MNKWEELNKPILYDFGYIGNRLIGLICLPFVNFKEREVRK